VQYPAFFHHFFCNVHQRYRNGQKRISLPVHTSRKTQVPALKRALADILSMNSHQDSAGDLSGGCQKTVQTPKCRRLPITKKSVERKDGGVVACQPVSFAHLHGIPHFRGDTGYQELRHQDRGHEPGCQSVEFCLENSCHLLCPCYQFPEEFLNHCNNEKVGEGLFKATIPGRLHESFLHRYLPVKSVFCR